MINSASLVADGKLPKFAADMFHVEGHDLWLTTTAETQLTNIHRDETFDADLLPEKLCAWTSCFRSEAGAAGKDTRGIKRQHQFQKVEMFKFTRPESSYDELELLVRDAEDLLQRLGLHYRVMLLCTGDMGFASSKTYDIEVWVPSSREFMEISSCSNCEAFQSRRAGIRFKPKSGKSEFAHTLNGSGLPIGRSWIAVVENYQEFHPGDRRGQHRLEGFLLAFPDHRVRAEYRGHEDRDQQRQEQPGLDPLLQHRAHRRGLERENLRGGGRPGRRSAGRPPWSG